MSAAQRSPTNPLPTLSVVRWPPDWCLDVAVSPEDWATASQLATFVPPDGTHEVDVRLHRDGTWWSVPGLPRVVVPWVTQVHRWSQDPPQQTRIVVRVPGPVELANRAVQTAEQLAFERASLQGRRRAAAIAIALDLEHGLLHDGLRQAARAFDEGVHAPAAFSWAERGLRARLALETVAQTAADNALIDALARADEALAPCGQALLMLEDADWVRLTSAHVLDDEAWWGSRQALLARVPRSAVEKALRSAAPRDRSARVALAGERLEQGRLLAAAADADCASDILALAKCGRLDARGLFESVMATLRSMPCKWLREDLRGAVARLEQAALAPGRDPDLAWRLPALREALAPAPGRVPVLLYVPELHRGLVLELRITRGGEGRWAQPELLLPVAREAVRTAYAAVAAVSDRGQPRYPLEEHSVELVGPEQLLGCLRGIDGSSLALAAAVAFASLWLEQTPASDVACSAALEVQGRTVRLRAVGSAGLASKVDALAAWGRGALLRVVVADHNPQDAVHAGVKACAKATLVEALAACALPMAGASGWSSLGDAATQQAEVERLIHELRTQDLRRHQGPGIGPWMRIGDRLRQLALALETAAVPGDSSIIRRARAYAALAFAHAGDAPAALALPSGEACTPDASPPIAVLGLLAEAVRAIAQERYADARQMQQALDEGLSACRVHERRQLLGIVRGTQGRAWMHDVALPAGARLERAIPLLQEAVAHHVAHVPVEAARSRVYLSMALRMRGQLNDALEQLNAAAAELEVHTRAWSGAYYRATRMYLAYERARVLVCIATADALREALQCTQDALDQADEHGSFWPSLGILRTRAWAYRLLGNHARLTACLQHLEAVGHTAPHAVAGLVARIGREAADLPRIDGETY